jgi:phasin family protein
MDTVFVPIDVALLPFTIFSGRNFPTRPGGKDMAKEQQSFIDMFARLGQDLKLPSMDIERVIEHHRKNLEALEKSARTASAGANAVMARQREMLQETLTEISGMVRDYRAPATAQELVEKQTEFARKSFETAVRNTSEVADMAGKSGSESLDILRRRIREGMAEIRESYEKRK